MTPGPALAMAGGKGARPRPPKAAPPRTRATAKPSTAHAFALKGGFATSPDVPSFMGAASRKRKWEIAAERGLVAPLGHSQELPGYGYPPPGYVLPMPQYVRPRHPGAGMGSFRPPSMAQARSLGAKKGHRPVPARPAKGAIGGDVDGDEDQQGEEEDDPATTQEAPRIQPPARGNYGQPKQVSARQLPPSAKAAASGRERAAPRKPSTGLPGTSPAAANISSGATPELVKWITLDPSAPFVEMGLPELAPALFYAAELHSLLTSSQYILSDLGVSAEAVELKHDPDWRAHPEVGDAMKRAGCEEACFCIAECPERRIWAVGAGNKWKQREQAARLALCVALAANADDFERLARAHPEFTALCEDVGIATGCAGAPPICEDVGAPGAGGKQGPGRGALAAWVAPRAPLAPRAPPGPDFPREVPMWIRLSAEEVPSELEALPLEALVLSTTGGNRKGLYSQADTALAQFIADPTVDVVYHDDPEWKLFPAVGAALKKIHESEECMCVAVCIPTAVWAVGVGMKNKARVMAAKAALAVSIALQTNDMGQDVIYDDFPAIADMVQEAQAARLGDS